MTNSKGLRPFLRAGLAALLLGSLALVGTLTLLGEAHAQSSVLLPNGRQQFLDANGDPLAAGQVFFYIPNTLTLKSTWQDADNLVLNSNPVVLDSAGSAVIYGNGDYRQIVKDVFGATVWDAETAGIAGPFPGWGGTSTGSANAQVITASSFQLTAGSQIAWRAGFTNSGPLTLTVGSDVLPVLKPTQGGPVPLTGNEVTSGNIAVATYDATLGALQLAVRAFGSMAEQNSSSVSITGGNISGTTIDLSQSADPTPTSEGQIAWSTLFDDLKVGDGTGTKRFLPIQPGYLYGCGTANNTTDATNDIDFAECRATDSTGSYLMVGSALTKRLDANWTVGAGGGMRDTGSIANATWHLFEIMRPDTGVVDYLASLSATAPTLPTNYTVFRRIGSIIRGGGSIQAYVQNGNSFTWSTMVRDLSTSSPSTTAVTLGVTVPSGISVVAQNTLGLRDTSVSISYYLVTALTQADTAPSSSAFTMIGGGDSSASTVTGYAETQTDTSAQIRYRSSTSSAGNFYILTTGWIDSRGQY